MRIVLRGFTSLLALSILATAPAFAAVATTWPPDPVLTRHPEEIPVPQDEPSQRQLRSSHAGVRDFLKANPRWRATVDPATAGIDRAFGDGLALDHHGRGPGGGATAVDLDSVVREFLAEHRGLFPPGLQLDHPQGAGSRLLFDESSSRFLNESGLRVLHLSLSHDGLPVLGAGLSLGVRDDAVLLIAAQALAPVTASSRAALSSQEALVRVQRWLQDSGSPAPTLVGHKEGRLAFYPRSAINPAGQGKGLKHDLVWILDIAPEGTPLYERFVGWVDARTGEVLAFFPEAQTLGSCQADPNQSRARVTGGVRPNSATDAEVVRPLPWATVTIDGVQVDADRNGRFPYTGGITQSTLSGRFFKSRCDNCFNPFQPLAPGNGSGDVLFGTGGDSSFTPTIGNGTSTPANRSAFFHLNLTRELLGKWNSTLFGPIDVYANIESSCNAWSGSYGLGFFVQAGNCRNTAEIRDVVAHELGHTWDRFDGNDITSGPASEWKGDMVALAMAGDSCVGETFRVSGGPTTACNGVRDIDERAAGRTDHPLTPAVCPTCATLTRTVNNCGSSFHCNGEIVGQAAWHMLRNMQTGADYITGLPIPGGNSAFSAEQARWNFERLVLGGGSPIITWNPTAAGLSAYDAFMLMDDDDGNLANGTPNAAYINAGFLHHEVAETPLVNDKANCLALDDPAVTATLESDPATGLATVRLDWTGSPGQTYDVFRNTRDGDAFLPLELDLTTGGPVSDIGVHSGITYRYFVAAVRKSGCAAISPGLNIQTVTVTPPTLRVASVVAAEVVGASDGDGRIEPGEKAQLQVTLGEAALAMSATGVTASVSIGSANSQATMSGPVAYGTVPAGGTAPGASPFEILVGPAESCGGTITVQLSASGDDGCWQDTFPLMIAGPPSCAETPSAFVQPDPGSLSVAPGGGDADGVPDNCEYASVTYLIRNTGTLASGPASATVSTSHPGVTFLPTPPCAVASLAGGATALCSFSFTLFGAAPGSGIPFILTADSASNPAPASATAILVAEAQPLLPFGTLSFGFNGPALDGWAGAQFSLSNARFSEGVGSARSGSTSQKNICGSLTSPAILIKPTGVSTLAFSLYADIEPFTGEWYDRANVHIIDDVTGQHFVVAPSGGEGYIASGNSQGGLCHITNEPGWADLVDPFSPVTFNLSAWAGRRIRIEINYNSDEGDDREGIYIDALSVTDAALAMPPADTQGNVCVVPEVSGASASIQMDAMVTGAASTLFTFEDLGPGFQYNVYAGVAGVFYGHGATPLLCGGLGGGISCDGVTCSFEVADALLPAGNLYVLVTATAFGQEGPSGFDSAAIEISTAESTCLP